MSIYSPQKKVFFALVAAVWAFSAPLAGVSQAADELRRTPTADYYTPGAGERSYILGAGNTVQIKIYGEGSINQIYRLDEEGDIRHALVGSVKLAGLTVAEAEKTMEAKLSREYIINPRVTIFVLEHSKFSILGEVKRPGTYEIVGRVSIIEAISMAGGFTAVAQQRDVKIQRRKASGQEETIRVDAARITNQGHSDVNVYMEADDVVVVPKSFF